MHLGLAVRVQQLQKPPPHQETWLIRGHVTLDVTAGIDADVVLGIDFLKSQRIWMSFGSQQIFLMRR